MFRLKPATNEIYHIYNRGVEKRKTFLDNQDHLRFIHDLFEFNNEEPTTISLNYHFSKSKTQSLEVGLPKINRRKPRKLIIDLLAFCLMPNHFHLIIQQRVENGVTNFMRKLGTGYTNYFNKKHERVGPLFQGKFKSTSISKEGHLLYLPHYIHFNPLDLHMPEWRDKKITNNNQALSYLKSYRWSSLLDYMNVKNFPSITSRSFYRSLTSIDYTRQLVSILDDFNIEYINDIAME